MSNPSLLRFALYTLAWACIMSMHSPCGRAEPAVGRLRVIIETDAGGDPDDEQSLVRFLLYVNEWDVEGIIANRRQARDGENRNPERTGLGIVRRLIRAYGECHPRLILHDPRYPASELLLERTFAGYPGTDDAVRFLIAAVDRPDPRPLWYADWGTEPITANNLRRALDVVRQERGDAGYARFKERLRILGHNEPGERNFLGPHATAIAPPFKLWVDTFRPELEGKRWYHRFSALTATAGGFDVQRDLLHGHGPLGALYPTNTTHPQKEGDTMTFLYLVPTGMNDPDQPTWGSWAGRYGRNPTYPDHPFYLANQADDWQGTIHRDNTLKRWSADLQNDFRARLQWCVKPFAEANHPPVAILNGHEGKGILRLAATAGATAELTAAASTDPDGQALAYEWFVYPEAGTYAGKVSLQGADTPMARCAIPGDAAGKTIHVILALRDTGSPPLVAYRRAVITVR